jgi:hypothetical protein
MTDTTEPFRIVWTEPENPSARPVLQRPVLPQFEPPKPAYGWGLNTEDPDHRYWTLTLTRPGVQGMPEDQAERSNREVTLCVVRDLTQEGPGQHWDAIVTDTFSGYFIHGRDYPTSDAAKVWAEYAAAEVASRGLQWELRHGPSSHDISRNLRERLFAGYPNAQPPIAPPTQRRNDA